MTTIAIRKYKNYTICCSDSQLTDNNEIQDHNVGGIMCHKIIKHNNVVIVGAGDYSVMVYLKQYIYSFGLCNCDDIFNIVRYFKEYLKFYNNITEKSIGSVELGLCVYNKIYNILLDSLEVYEIDKILTIGSGRQYALSALMLNKSPREAVKLASKLDCYTRLPIHEYIIQHKK